MDEVVDGEYQKYTVEAGEYIREHFFGKYPELLQVVEHCRDDDCKSSPRGGHDPEKVYAAYKAAVEQGQADGHPGQDHQGLRYRAKAAKAATSRISRRSWARKSCASSAAASAFPISDDEVGKTPFYRPAEDSPKRFSISRAAQGLGGFVPERRSSR